MQPREKPYNARSSYPCFEIPLSLPTFKVNIGKLGRTCPLSYHELIFGKASLAQLKKANSPNNDNSTF